MEVLVFILLEEMGVIVAITQKGEMEETGDQDFIPLGQMVIKRDVMEGMAAQVSILLGKSALKKGKSKRVVGGVELDMIC